MKQRLKRNDDDDKTLRIGTLNVYDRNQLAYELQNQDKI